MGLLSRPRGAADARARGVVAVDQVGLGGCGDDIGGDDRRTAVRRRRTAPDRPACGRRAVAERTDPVGHVSLRDADLPRGADRAVHRALRDRPRRSTLLHRCQLLTGAAPVSGAGDPCGWAHDRADPRRVRPLDRRVPHARRGHVRAVHAGHLRVHLADDPVHRHRRRGDPRYRLAEQRRVRVRGRDRLRTARRPVERCDRLVLRRHGVHRHARHRRHRRGLPHPSDRRPLGAAPGAHHRYGAGHPVRLEGSRLVELAGRSARAST